MSGHAEQALEQIGKLAREAISPDWIESDRTALRKRLKRIAEIAEDGRPDHVGYRILNPRPEAGSMSTSDGLGSEQPGPSRFGIRNNSGEIVGEKWILTTEQVDYLLAALEHFVTGDPRKRAKAEAQRGNLEWEDVADLYEKLTGESIPTSTTGARR